MACAALTTSLTAGCVDSGATTSTGLTSETASAVGYGGVPTLPDRFPIPKALTSAEQRRNAPSSVTASIGTDGAVESLEIPEQYDLIAFDAAAGTDIVVSFDVTDAVGKTALAVLEPDGSVLEQVHADGDGAVYVPKTVRTGGTHFVQVAGLENSSGKYSLSVSTNETTAEQSPYQGTVSSLPGRIQAEDFDIGGEGVSYHDTSEGNEYDTSYRDTSVDIRRTQDSSGQYNIGYFQDGEWLEYTVDPTPGTYDLRVRVASANSGRQLKLTLDGEPLATVDVPNTGGWRNWETVTLENLDINTDAQSVLRLEAVKSGIDLNWFEFEPKSSQRPYEESAVKLPDRVQAEDFDVGGEGVSYHDTSEGNEYDTSYRDTSVDIRRTQDSSGQYNIGYFQDGEWLEYTVDPTSGTYDLRVRVASANSGRQLKLTLDGEPLVTIDVPNTGGWRNWETVRVRGVGFDSDGEQVLRFEAVGSGIDLNWFEVVGSSDSDSDYGELSYGEQQYGGSSS